MLKFKDQLIIGTICVVLGIAIAMQFKAVQVNYLAGLIPTQRSQQLVTELEKLKQDKAVLVDELNQLKSELDVITENAADENTVLKNMQDQLNRFKLLSGFTEVEGPGLVVVIDNPLDNLEPNAGINIVNQYSLILEVVNELNASGAEAIMVNNQRLISSSEIRTAGDYISINGTLHKAPFVIKAIGNKDVLDSGLTMRFGIIDYLRDLGYQVDVTRLDEVIISPYMEVLQWQYAKTRGQ